MEVDTIWKEFYPFKPSEIKFLATLVEYDRGDFLINFEKYRAMSGNQQKANTLDNFILKYGEKIGREKFMKKNEDSANTLDRMIERHGEVIGREKYETHRLSKKDPLTMFKKKYGDMVGLEKYNDWCYRNKGNHSLERKLEMYPEDEAVDRYKSFIEGARKRATLDGCIELYGLEEGSRKYFEKRAKIEFGGSAEGFKEKYGDDYREIMRISKNNTSLESFIGRYGDEQGIKKYNEYLIKMSFANSLKGYQVRYGVDEGYRKYFDRRINNGCKFGVSPVSQQLFKSLHHEGREYYADLNHEYLLLTSNGCFYIDYVNKDRMKAVEFNGDVFHANPDIFHIGDRPNPYDKTKTSEDIWKYDEIKLGEIRNRGFDVLVIWEKEYRQDAEGVVRKVNEFVYGK